MTTRNQAHPSFVPPHCPNRNCLHHNRIHEPWFYKKHGYYHRSGDRRTVPRYMCGTCGVTFSSQTFSTTYWQKRPELTEQVFMKSVGCMGLRQIARDLKAAPETISRHLARLGRHCLLLHSQTWTGGLTGQAVVVDGFESFEYSQYHPMHFNVAVEPETDFFLSFTDSELRRKGRMTKHQKKRRTELEEEHGRPDPKAIEKAMADLLTQCLRSNHYATIRSDEHPAYPRAIRRAGIRARHELTNSKEHRTARNPLWAVNLLDLIIRHSQANHKRETIAFSKRRQCAIERMLIFLVWRNYVKSHREKRPGTTPAMLKGLTSKVWSIKEILQQRLFPERTDLTKTWRSYYERVVQTREILRCRGHDLSYAF